jgi:prepilin-type N-terminal cleavage/methylation domain-containing protein
MTRSRTTGFTLIEMLTVIVIIGIVLAMGIPAITNLMKSGGLNAATRQVASTLSLARQYAITHRTTTLVVFPYSGTIGAGTNLAPVYQSYAVLDYGATTNYLTKWEHLPLGTVFMSQYPTVTVDGSPPALDNLKTVSVRFPNTNSVSGTATLAYIGFTPTGAGTQPLSGSANSFTITEGLMNGGSVTPTSRTRTNSNTVLANAVAISVDSVMGRIQVTRP